MELKITINFGICLKFKLVTVTKRIIKLNYSVKSTSLNATLLSAVLGGNDITVSDGVHNFTLTFYAVGTDNSNDASLDTISGFIGLWNGISGTGDVIGTSCKRN